MRKGIHKATCFILAKNASGLCGYGSDCGEVAELEIYSGQCDHRNGLCTGVSRGILSKT